VFCYSLGLLLGYILGSYAGYHAFPWAMLPLNLLFILTVAFLPDSPYYFVKKNQDKVRDFLEIPSKAYRRKELVHLQNKLFPAKFFS
jgi:hypothetical protein